MIDLNKSRDPRKYVVLVQGKDGYTIAYTSKGEQLFTKPTADALKAQIVKTSRVYEAVGVYKIE